MQPATKKDDIDIFRMNVNFQKCGVDLTDQFDDLNQLHINFDVN